MDIKFAPSTFSCETVSTNLKTAAFQYNYKLVNVNLKSLFNTKRYCGTEQHSAIRL